MAKPAHVAMLAWTRDQVSKHRMICQSISIRLIRSASRVGTATLGLFSRQIGKKDVVNIAVHMDAESVVPLDRLCRGQGVVELTRLVPKPMNYFFFVLVVPLWPTLEIGVHNKYDASSCS